MKRATQRYYAPALLCFRNSGDPCFAFQWMFSYIGFPVELNTLYFIGAHNIPNANMNDDSPSMSVNFASPGKLPHSLLLSCWEACFGVRGLVQRGQSTLDKAFSFAKFWNTDNIVTAPHRVEK